MRLHAWASFFAFLALGGMSGCRKDSGISQTDPVLASYDSEPDWSDNSKMIPLGYEQSQGKRIFYQQCVWCHADATPAGPSNRSNLTPVPPLLNDGAALNVASDEYMQNIITLGGSALGRSAMMPPYGGMLTAEQIHSVIAFTRAVAQPPYQPAPRPGPGYSAK